jgi:hypothetical protein
MMLTKLYVLDRGGSNTDNVLGTIELLEIDRNGAGQKLERGRRRRVMRRVGVVKREQNDSLSV